MITRPLKGSAWVAYHPYAARPDFVDSFYQDSLQQYIEEGPKN